MDLKVSNKNVHNVPLIVVNKHVITTSNAYNYQFGGLDYNTLPQYSLLLVEDEQVKGYFSIIENNAPKDIFMSSNNGSINLKGIKQLQIEAINIPQGWIDSEILYLIFEMWQHSMRVYFEGRRMIVWFENGEYEMCPVATNVDDNEYQHFADHMTNLIMSILQRVSSK